jgi:hypothetical protein
MSWWAQAVPHQVEAVTVIAGHLDLHAPTGKPCNLITDPTLMPEK